MSFTDKIKNTIHLDIVRLSVWQFYSLFANFKIRRKPKIGIIFIRLKNIQSVRLEMFKCMSGYWLNYFNDFKKHCSDWKKYGLKTNCVLIGTIFFQHPNCVMGIDSNEPKQ